MELKNARAVRLLKSKWYWWIGRCSSLCRFRCRCSKGKISWLMQLETKIRDNLSRRGRRREMTTHLLEVPNLLPQKMIWWWFCNKTDTAMMWTTASIGRCRFNSAITLPPNPLDPETAAHSAPTPHPWNSMTPWTKSDLAPLLNQDRKPKPWSRDHY